MWSNENFILAPLEVKRARKRLFFSFLFIFSIFFSIFFQVLSFPLQEKNKLLLANQITNGLNRANIVDRNGSLMATSIPAWSISAHPHEVLEPRQSAITLHKLMPEKSLEFLTKQLESNSKYVEIDRVSSPRRIDLILNSGVTGIHFSKTQTRLYPKGNLASHILGNVNRDGIGLAGIEHEMDDKLKSNLNSVQLTIDTNIQYILETEIKKQIKFFEAKSAAGIVLNVTNGEILAISSYPTFDVNFFGEASSNQKFNRATFGNYDMGSTFKLINTAIAIDSGKVKLEEKFNTTKPLKFGRHRIDDFRYLDKPANVAEILVNSSNIGSALIAERIGPETQKHYFDLLELTKKPDLPLLEVSKPIFNSKWPRLTSITASYGYGIAVSPIQLASAISCIFNDGKFITPKLIKNKNEIIKKRVFSKKTSLTMRKLARAVVTHPDGSGKKANAYGYLVGGKTGTAEIISNSGGFKKNANLSSFIGAFPINAPKFLVLVLIEEPKPQFQKLKHNYTTGGQVAAPVVRKIIQKIAPILNVHPIVKNLPKIEQTLKLDILYDNSKVKNASL
ncbi:MAG: cell division protein FtsI [SAR116 cluster bacterium]|nr:cell division protein FtsI [SAR116 cluster bacterium]